jgi:hypothetical protein
MSKLKCEECGYSRDVELEDDNGRSVSAEEYMAALKLTGQSVLCSACAAALGALLAHGTKITGR